MRSGGVALLLVVMLPGASWLYRIRFGAVPTPTSSSSAMPPVPSSWLKSCCGGWVGGRGRVTACG
jgi:hypothetical protein